MRVAHLVQQPQRLLELGKPTSSKKEGGPIGQPRRENPSRVTGTSGGSGERDSSQPCGTNRRDLPPLRWKPTEGPYVPLHDVECSRELLRKARQCSQ